MRAFGQMTIVDLIDDLVWKGHYDKPPENPRHGWAYYNTTEGKSYIYNAQKEIPGWEIFAANGQDGVGIKSTVRFYILANDKPEEPKTLEPEGWFETEPPFDKTKNLYFIDRTIFTDGTYDYSPVVLSSTYEGIKDAQDKVDGLDIGGKNLLLNSQRKIESSEEKIVVYDTTPSMKNKELVTFSAKVNPANDLTKYEIRCDNGQTVLGTLTSKSIGLQRIYSTFVMNYKEANTVEEVLRNRKISLHQTATKNKNYHDYLVRQTEPWEGAKLNVSQHLDTKKDSSNLLLSWDGANLTRCGENLLGPNNKQPLTSYKYVHAELKEGDVIHYYGKSYEDEPSFTTFTMKGLSQSLFPFISVKWEEEGESKQIKKIWTFLEDGYIKVGIEFNTKKNEAVDSFVKIWVVSKENQSITFVPFKGKHYAIDFQEKIYAGDINWTEGKIIPYTVTKVDGNSNWVQGPGKGTYILRGVQIKVSNDRKTVDCNGYNEVPFGSNEEGYYITQQNELAFNVSSFTTLEAWKNELNRRKGKENELFIVHQSEKDSIINFPGLIIRDNENMNFFYSDSGKLSLNRLVDSTKKTVIEWAKLEKGNQPTDWTPAPEEVQEDIDSTKVAIKTVDVYYGINSSPTEAPTKWDTKPPKWENGKYIWSKNITTLLNGGTTESKPVCITGAKGEVTYTWIRYAKTITGEGISNVPTPDTPFIGFAYNKLTASESNNPKDYTWSRMTGEQGVPGINGYTWIKYSDNANGENCYDTPTEATKYIGIAINKQTTIESKNPADYTWSKFRGEDGNSITGTSIKYCWSNSGTTHPEKGWEKNIPSNPSGLSFLWTRTETTYSKADPVYGYSVSRDGIDGNSITGYFIEYCVSTNGTKPPVSGWKEDFPASSELKDGLYLWTKTTVNYSKSPSVTGYTVNKSGKNGLDGQKGNDGVTIVANNVTYAVTNSSTPKPKDEDYGGFPSKLEDGQYLWTRVYVKYSDGKESISYSISKNGTNGSNGAQGNPGESAYIHIKYSDDGRTFTPKDGTYPHVGERPGNYLGQYTDNLPKDSEKFEDYYWKKIKGTDGTTLKSTSVTYASSSNGTNPPQSGWKNSIAELGVLGAGIYLWAKTYILYSDGKSTTTYSASRNGTNGGKGDPGNPGKTSYIHIKYSNDGGKSFTGQSNPNDPKTVGEVPGSWIGQYTDFVAEDWITNTSKYKWSKIKGTDGKNGLDGVPGADGAPGQGVESITELYRILTTKDQLPTPTSDKDWRTTPPTWSPGHYIHTCSKIVYVNPSKIVYTKPICDSSWEAVNEIEIGGRNLVQKKDYSEENQYQKTELDGQLFNGQPVWKMTKKNDGTPPVQFWSFDILPGQTYVGSVYVKQTVSPTMGKARVIFYKATTYSWVEATQIGQWERLVLTYKNETKETMKDVQFYFYGSQKTGEVTYFSCPQLELGNKPTDWTPAPEDVQDQIDSNKNNIEINGYEITPNQEQVLKFKKEIEDYSKIVLSPADLRFSVTKINNGKRERINWNDYTFEVKVSNQDKTTAVKKDSSNGDLIVPVQTILDEAEKGSDENSRSLVSSFYAQDTNAITCEVFKKETNESVRKVSLLCCFGLDSDGAKINIHATGIDASIQSTKLNFDTDGLTVRNGGFRIYKKTIDESGQNTGEKLVFYADNDGNLNLEGVVRATDGEFTGKLIAATGDFSGKITAGSGKIANFVIQENNLYSNDKQLLPQGDETPNSFSFLSRNSSIILNSKEGKIKADNISLGTGAEIQDYIKIGNNVTLYNPKKAEDSFIEVKNKNGKLLDFTQSGELIIGNIGKIHLDGKSESIYSQNYSNELGWKISNEEAVFNNIVAKGSLKASVFEYGEVQTIGGILLVRPSSRIIGYKNSEDKTKTLIYVEAVEGFNIKEYCQIQENSGPKYSQILEVDLPNKIIYLQGEMHPKIGTPIVDFGKNQSVGISINGSIDKSLVPANSVSVFSFDENDKTLTPKIVLGLLPKEPKYGFAQGTYGLYAENVILKGSLVTETTVSAETARAQTQNIYSGISTLYSGDSAPKSDLYKEYFGEGNTGEILLWAGAEGSEKSQIEKSKFFVDRKGNIYAGSGYFNGTIITDATITASRIKTAVIEGLGTDTPALLIEDAKNGILFKGTNATKEKIDVFKVSVDSITAKVNNLKFNDNFKIDSSGGIQTPHSVVCPNVEPGQSKKALIIGGNKIEHTENYKETGNSKISTYIDFSSGITFGQGDINFGLSLNSIGINVTSPMRIDNSVNYGDSIKYQPVYDSKGEITGYDLYVE